MAIIGIGSFDARGDLVEYSRGHADIALRFNGSGIVLDWQFDSGAVLGGNTLTSSIHREPSGAYARVGDAAQFIVGSAVDFLGVNSGSTVWILPAFQNTALPFLGTSSEGLSGFNPAFTANSLKLTGFAGPGNFALWQVSGFGTSTVLFRTNDGLADSDIINPAINSHAHYNWGFTSEGVYDLTILATASRGSEVFTDTGTFRFVVGSATAVPEPGVVAFVALAGIGLLFNKRRKCRKREFTELTGL